MRKKNSDEKTAAATYARICKMVRAIDKRVIVFEFIGDQLYAPEEMSLLLGIDEGQWALIKRDKQMFSDFMLEKTTETGQSEKENGRHQVGIIDENERYIICHVFLEEEHVYGFLVDKSEEIYGKFHMREKFREARRESETDMLTGLLNRNGFEGAVKKELLENPAHGILLIMDMDNFKKVNDMLGHPVGDRVLKQFAGLLQDYFAETASVTGRLGGDEFVVFMPGELSAQELQEMLFRFITAVKAAFAVDYPEQKLSASIGAAYADLEAHDYADLYKKADAALYHVKENGKGNYHIG